MGQRTEVVTDSWRNPYIATASREEARPTAARPPRSLVTERHPAAARVAPHPAAAPTSAPTLSRISEESSESSVGSDRLTRSCESVDPRRCTVPVPGRKLRRPQKSIMAMVYEQGVPMNPDPRALTFQRLEAIRLKKLGISPSKYSYSRHFQNVFRNPHVEADSAERLELAGSGTQIIQEAQSIAAASSSDNASKDQISTHRMNNSVAPFATVGKPTCGYFFSDRTDNKKTKFGIPPSDLVKWRNYAPHQA